MLNSRFSLLSILYTAAVAAAKLLQSCPTVCDPMDYTVDGILQARILEWGAFPFSRGSSQPRDWTQVSHIAGGFFTSWATREAQVNIWPYYYSNNSCWLARACWLYYCNKCFPPAKSDRSNDFCNYYCATCSLDKKSKTFFEIVVITVIFNNTAFSFSPLVFF